MDEESIIAEATERVSNLSTGRDLLCIQDTTEFNLYSHKHRIKDNSGFGRLDKAGEALGFKMHPVFVIDNCNGIPLGFSFIKMWHRPLDMPNRRQRNYKGLPIEQKESYKWIEAANGSKSVLNGANSITFVQDREADIYELLNAVPDERTHLVIRSKADRALEGGDKLWQRLSTSSLKGISLLDLKTDYRKNTTKRQAQLEIRYCACEVVRPHSASRNCSSKLPIHAIEAREINVPIGQKPIHWKLITTKKIDTVEDARNILDIYKQRWFIEQLFRLLKNEGFNLEDSELESGWAIRKLCVMMMVALLKILQMRLSWDEPEGGQPIEEVFSQQEKECLNMLCKRMEGKTYKLQNQNDPKRLKWTTWIIARLGGWKGYDSQGPPGPIVLKRGVERFGFILQGYTMAKDVGTQ